MNHGSLVAPLHDLEVSPIIAVPPHTFLILPDSKGPVNPMGIPNKATLQQTRGLTQLLQ
nr:hypothetical protein [Pontibacter sp. 172403-2]